MKKPADDFEPTEADIDMVVEAATGKPVKPGNLAAGIASLHQRITQFENEKLILRSCFSGQSPSRTNLLFRT